MTKKNGAGRGRGRSKRQRTPTTLYSDDNPSTFTTKTKRNGDVSEPEAPAAKSPSRSKPLNFFDEGLPLKRSYRKKKVYNRHALQSTINAQRESSDESNNEEEAVPEVKLPTSPTRKRRRPLGSTTPNVIAAPPKIDATPSKVTSRAPAAVAAVPKPTWTPSLHDVEGTFLSHSVKVAPILPPILDNKMNSMKHAEQQYPKVFGSGLGKDSALEKTNWTPLNSPIVFFEDDYSSDDNRGLDPSVLPVTRSISCITTRKPDNQYMAVGDDAGFCIIYSMGAHIRPVARLETVACQQRARYEQEKIREQIRKNKGKLRSLIKDTSEITIHAIGMVGTRVVLATSCELECMDVPSQTSLWVCPLTPDRLVTSLDMHVSTYDVLVSCNILKQNARKNTPLAQAPTSPLMLLQHSRNNIEICDANSPLLVKSPCCTAIWDASKSAENRLLFVAVSDTDQELELVLVQGGSIDNWKVACKTRIPVKACNHQTRLCQSPEGIYTLVASSRGIRLYQTETLQLINTYGDQLALHGKSVVWQDCLLLNSNQYPNTIKKFNNNNLICTDWLTESSDDADEQNTNDLGPYLIGVPNFKGPKELCESLHAWRVEQASTVPTLSIPLPPRAEGVKGLIGAPVMGNDRLVLATRSGFGHTLLPKVESNFAGIMYPPGYNVINDNLEYIEDEDELDFVEKSAEPEDEEMQVDVIVEGEMDEDLREAMRQSLLEKKLHDAQEALKDRNVDVLTVDNELDNIIPCRPEPYLRQAVNASLDEDSDVDRLSAEEQKQEDQKEAEAQADLENSGPAFIEKILDSMPNAPKKKELSEDGITVSVTKVIVATTNPIASRPGRVKRSRAANLEAVLKASVDPRLQKYMIARQNVWSDGIGSTLVKEMQDDSNADANGEGAQETNMDGEGAAKQVTPSPAVEKDVMFAPVNHREVKSSDTEGSGKANGKSADIAIKTSLKSDEAAVALGLLGLSPCNTSSEPRNPDSLRSESLSPTNGSETASRPRLMNHPLMLNHVVYSRSESAASSDTASEVASTSVLMDIQAQPKPKVNCNACRGRYVVHTCGKRTMPIDYDEVAKAERERKEKEEEEKKKVRAEKRRLADARRREARKLKQIELEEQRRREEEEDRLAKDRIRFAEEATYLKPQTHSSLSHVVNSHLQGDLVASSYANGNSRFEQQAASQPVETAAPLYTSRLGASYVTQEMTHNNWGTARESEAPAQPPSVVRRSSAGTLSSADALVALASFAGSSAAAATSSLPNARIAIAETARSSTSFGGAYETNPFAAAAAVPAATHNFGAGLPISSVSAAVEAKRAIPSYASIRGVTNNRLVEETKMVVEGTVAAEQINGTSQQSSSGYVWPPQKETRVYTKPSSEAYSTFYKST